jgi:hypothetical protein
VHSQAQWQRQQQQRNSSSHPHPDAGSTKPSNAAAAASRIPPSPLVSGVGTGPEERELEESLDEAEWEILHEQQLARRQQELWESWWEQPVKQFKLGDLATMESEVPPPELPPRRVAKGSRMPRRALQGGRSRPQRSSSSDLFARSGK